MADTVTTTLGLTKPEVGASEDSWGEKINTNFDLVDDALDGTTAVSLDINGGTIDGAVIGGATPAAGTFTTLTANTSLGGTLSTAAQPNVTSVGTLTSLDVSGTANADAFSLDAGSQVSSVGTFYLDIDSDNNSTGAALNITSDNKAKFLARFQEGGDISFYEDTGTTPKFFWDASAESLGIGTSSPSTKLQVTGDSSSRNTIVANATLDGGTTVPNPYEGFGFGINFIGRDYGNAVRNYASINTVMESKSSASGGGDAGFKTGLSFYTNGGGASDTDPSERMRIDASGNVGIGTTNPIADLSIVDSSTGSGIEIQPEVTTDTNRITNYDRVESAYKKFRLDASEQQFYISGSEAMRIDSSGNLLVGQSTSTAVGAGNTTTGFSIRNDGGLYVSRSSGPTITANANADGDIIKLYKSGSTVGSIGAYGGDVYIGTGDAGLWFQDGGNAIRPFRVDTQVGLDNSIDLGHSSNRFDDIYATNGTIQTSDRNEKQDIEALSDAEQRVAQACKGLLRKFRWIDAVAEKGDDARIHFGIIAQDLQDAFAAEGLNAGRYAMFISSTWWETQTEVPAVEVDEENGIEAKDAYTRTDTYETLEEAPEGATERTRLGVRYPELLAFIIAAI